MMEAAAGEEPSPSRGSRFSISAARGRSNDRRLLIEDDGLGGHEAAGGVAATSASASYGSMPDSGSDMTRPHPGKISPKRSGLVDDRSRKLTERILSYRALNCVA